MRHPAARALVWAVALLAVSATLLIGGVHPWTQVALSAAALVISTAFLFLRGQRGVRIVPFAAPAALALGFTVVQLVPLPSALVRFVSPRAWELRESVLGAAAAWMPITVDVPATLLELVKGFACLGLLLTVAGLARPLQRAHRALLPIAFLGGGLALLVFAQRLFGATTILGYHVRSMPGSGFYGTLVNGNHAASIFALSALIAIGLSLELEGGRRFALLWAAGLSIAGLLATTSRGGAVGLAVGGALLALIALARRVGKLQATIAALTLLALSTGGALWLADGLRSRLVPSSAHEIWSNGKTRGWRDGLMLARAYAFTGVGRGAFEAPLTAYRVTDDGVRLVYPENLVVQMASEWGLPISAALIVLALLSARRVRARLSRLEIGTVGAACGVVAVLVHELADFGLEMPGVALPTVVALGVVIARWQEKLDAERERLPRVKPPVAAAVAAAWAAALAGGAWAAGRTLDGDVRRLTEARAANSPTVMAELDAAIARHPASAHLELLAATEALKRRDPSSLKHLNRALILHPTDWQAHRLAARELQALGHPQQAALEYRLALENGMMARYDELWAVLHARVLDAVPQRTPDLLALGAWLAGSGHTAEGDAACVRAVDAATRAESASRERLRIAVTGGDRKIVAAAAAALVKLRPDPVAYVAAAQALARSGDSPGALQAIRDGMSAHPDDSALVLAGARLYLDGGDLQQARALLKREGDGSFTLADRQAAAELSAQVAERAGDVDGAVLARARARLLARKLQDGSGPQVY